MPLDLLKYKSSLLQPTITETFEEKQRRKLSMNPRAIALHQPPGVYEEFIPPHPYVDAKYVYQGYVEYTY